MGWGDRRATEESRKKVEGGVDGSNLQELEENNGASRQLARTLAVRSHIFLLAMYTLPKKSFSTLEKKSV